MFKPLIESAWFDQLSMAYTNPGAVAALTMLLTLIAMLIWHRLERKRWGEKVAREQQVQELQWQQSLARLDETKLRLEDELAAIKSELKSKEQALHSLELNFRAQAVRMDEQQKRMAVEKDLLVKQSEQLSREFELLANRLFDAKQEQFTRSARSNLEQVIAPFQNQLRDFYERIDNAQKSDSAQRNQLLGEISALQKQSQQLSADAVNLANALKGNNKTMGNWGEVVLARLLEQSGLCKGREYEIQFSDTNHEGKRLQPDVIVHLPDRRHVVIDAKVSLVSFERYMNSDDEQTRNTALKAHVESVRAHVKSLAGKRYEDLMRVQSLDFVFMFIPIESAFLLVAQQSPEVLDEAFRKNIVVTSPSSLMVALKTVEALWQRKKQEQNIDEIVASAGKLYDQFVRFAESLQEVGAGLTRAKEAYDTTLSRLCDGRGNLIKRAEDLKSLGARTSKVMPAALAARSQQPPLVSVAGLSRQEDT